VISFYLIRLSSLWYSGNSHTPSHALNTLLPSVENLHSDALLHEESATGRPVVIVQRNEVEPPAFQSMLRVVRLREGILVCFVERTKRVVVIRLGELGAGTVDYAGRGWVTDTVAIQGQKDDRAL
jgi:hypothetical protein